MHSHRIIDMLIKTKIETKYPKAKKPRHQPITLCLSLKRLVKMKV